MPTARLSGVTIPTLALAGGNSPAWAHDSVKTIAAAVPGGEYRILAGQDHGVLVPILQEFFG